MIRIFARGGVAAATEIQKPAQAAQKTGDELDKTASKSEGSSRRIVTHAQQMRRAFQAVAATAVVMGGRVQSGATSGTQAVAVMTRQVERLDRAMGRAKEQSAKFANVQEGLGKVGTAGMVMSGVAAGGGLAITKGLALAGQKELELKSIEAFEGSKSKADSIYKDIDGMSMTSVFELTDLMAAGKDLSKNRMFDKRYLTASDDLAAANKANGVDPHEVAKIYGRLKAGDNGDAFERMRDLGINKADLEAQGLKFNKSNQYEGTADDAIEGFTKAIEAKFKGLSEKLATETMTGALSNLSDAAGRAATEISTVLVPAVTIGTRWITAIGGLFGNLPGPIKAFIAWGGLIGVLVLGLAGGLLTMAAMLGQAAIGVMALTGGSAAAATTTAALAGAATAEAGAAGAATVGTQALAVSLISRLLPAMLTTMGVLILAAIAIYGFTTAVNGAADASTKSDAALRKSWGTWASIWIGLESLFSKMVNHPLFKVLAPGAYLAAKAAGLTQDGKGQGDAADQKLLDIENSSRKKRGERALSMQEFLDGRGRKGGGKISDGDEDATKLGDSPIPTASTTPPGVADMQKQLKDFLASQPATSGNALSAPTINGSGPGAVVPANFASGGGGSVADLQEQIMLTEDADKKKALNKQLFYARRAEQARKADERERKAEARAVEKDKKAQERALKKQQRELEKVERTQAAHQKRIDAQLASEALSAELDQVDAMVKANRLTKEQGIAQKKALRTQARRRALGMTGGGSRGLSGLAGFGGAADSTDEITAEYLAEARRAMAGMSRDQARAMVERRSQMFEKSGGFENEKQMDAYNSVLGQQFGMGGQGGPLSGLLGYLANGGSLRKLKDGKLPGGAGAINFGDGSTSAGGAISPQSVGGAERILTAQAKTQLIPQGAGKTILRILVPDVQIDNSFGQALAGVRRR